MINDLLFLAATLILSFIIDHYTLPYGRRSCCGLTLHTGVITAVYSFFLLLSGNALLSSIITLSIQSALMAISNAKYKMLGEPLIFSDFLVLVSVVRHPRFYLTALSSLTCWLLATVTPTLIIFFVIFNNREFSAHLRGFLFFVIDALVLLLIFKIPPFSKLAPEPALEKDVKKMGMVAVLFLYWQRWRESPDPMPLSLPPIIEEKRESSKKPEIVIVIQCESFMDPADLTHEGERAPLPALQEARKLAWKTGKLHVNGFGAYTMRTEYGVLFGREEKDLGFRQFDPFMTAKKEITYALSARLKHDGYHAIFVHPHDMRFYNRDDIMPSAGFSRLVGLDYFSSPKKGQRYVDDVTLGKKLTGFIEESRQPTFIYTVTMENHGPWDADGKATPEALLVSYIRHAESSDKMLGDLIDYFKKAKKRAILAFFGDHRPSIPAISIPSPERHTPYVFLCFDEKGVITASQEKEEDLAPAGLHRLIFQYSHELPDREA
ncbi:MAG: LTA synthase family protein [Zymomonas mobilis]|uniref:Phosphoglycerol transferase MdoB-like AlkP superfamily enzyme n=1 Tax=Zymomonas mobilis TaxID=542 RepID=A0A542VZ09_ZYMMB|nr:LTA synthase family protein [Zymomonas mobilis]TQL16533.1 phosphoglycerol transferase MdoB-like AlkP superfamily enzyme [Zymomonas mobilis]